MIRDNYTNGFHTFSAANAQIRIASPDCQVQALSPSASDVICGRGKKVFEHAGNVSFRNIVMSKIPDYKAAVSKAQKSAVVSSVFDEVSIEGNFIKQNPQTQKWYVVNESAAREKISQCFRDCLNDKNASSKTSSKSSSSCKTTVTKKRKQTKAVIKPRTMPELKLREPATTDDIPPPPKRTKLFRHNTAPATVAYNSRDAFQQLVMFSQSVMPPVQRSNSLQPSNPAADTPLSGFNFDDMEPLKIDSMEPVSFPSIYFPNANLNMAHPDLEPTPLPF